MPQQPRVEIVYCTRRGNVSSNRHADAGHVSSLCRWLLRAGWMAQELLTTFPDELGEVALVPGGGGVFDIRLNDELIWSRRERGGFPEIKALKQSIRDKVAPHRSLGHTDR